MISGKLVSSVAVLIALYGLVFYGLALADDDYDVQDLQRALIASRSDHSYPRISLTDSISTPLELAMTIGYEKQIVAIEKAYKCSLHQLECTGRYSTRSHIDEINYIIDKQERIIHEVGDKLHLQKYRAYKSNYYNFCNYTIMPKKKLNHLWSIRFSYKRAFNDFIKARCLFSALMLMMDKEKIHILKRFKNTVSRKFKLLVNIKLKQLRSYLTRFVSIGRSIEYRMRKAAETQFANPKASIDSFIYVWS